MKYYQQILLRTNVPFGISQSYYPRSSVDNHYHDHYELYYQEAGERKYFIKTHSYTIHTGDVVFIPPFALHHANKTEPGKTQRSVLYFSPQFCKELRDMSRQLFYHFENGNFIVSLDQPEQKKMKSILDTMMAEQRSRKKDFWISAKLLLGEILLLTNRSSQHMAGMTKKRIEPPMNPKILEAAKYIQSNFHNKLTLSDVASRLFINPSYLCRLFKQEMGFTFVEYVNYVRIETAKETIRKEEYSIAEIAELCGFENDSTFSRTFKTFTGISPSQYRKKHA